MIGPRTRRDAQGDIGGAATADLRVSQHMLDECGGGSMVEAQRDAHAGEADAVPGRRAHRSSMAP